MKEYFNILKYGMRNIYNKRIKSYGDIKGGVAPKKNLINFINNISSETVVVFIGLKQIKYYAGIDNPAEYMINLLQNKFKNILVPTFTASVKKTEFFDVQNTPSESGAFSNYFLKKAQFRTPSPLKSFAVTGPIVSKISKLQFENDFAPNGIFEYINKNNIPSLNIGTSDIRFACIHLAEYSKNVPYATVEKVNIKIKHIDGNIKTKNVFAFVYKINYKINRDKIEQSLIENKLIESIHSNELCMRYMSESKYFQFFLERIDDDPYYLIN